MVLDELTVAEREVVRECLKASVEGPFFPDWEFGVLFGVERERARKVLKAWPNVSEEEEVVSLVLNNAMNNLLGYPHECENVWHEHISVSPSEVARIFKKWRKIDRRS
jgi:hypothetical protein